jgi:hypothetical protein
LFEPASTRPATIGAGLEEASGRLIKNDGPIEVTVGERAASPLRSNRPATTERTKCGASTSSARAQRQTAQRAALGRVTSPVWELAAPGEPVSHASDQSRNGFIGPVAVGRALLGKPAVAHWARKRRDVSIAAASQRSFLVSVH